MSSKNAYEVIYPRLKYVIDGHKKSNIEPHKNCGFKFYELAPSLLVKHPKLPIYQINPEYTFDMVCQAICKIEGFTYAPSGRMHGYSSEHRFIHITEEFVNAEYVKSIGSTLGEGQSVLIYGSKVQSDMRLPDNVVVKRIQTDLPKKCSFESEVR
jgi:adenine-specific DNA-methyltransferase